MDNYLPEAHAVSQSSQIRLHQSLGIIAALSEAAGNHLSAINISEFTREVSKYIAAEQVFICMNEIDQPIGFITWEVDDIGKISDISNICTPFGDHLLILKSFKQNHVGDQPIMSFHHDSSRQVQQVW